MMQMKTIINRLAHWYDGTLDLDDYALEVTYPAERSILQIFLEGAFCTLWWGIWYHCPFIKLPEKNMPQRLKLIVLISSNC